jgi:hypothetical protein
MSSGWRMNVTQVKSDESPSMFFLWTKTQKLEEDSLQLISPISENKRSCIYLCQTNIVKSRINMGRDIYPFAVINLVALDMC